MIEKVTVSQRKRRQEIRDMRIREGFQNSLVLEVHNFGKNWQLNIHSEVLACSTQLTPTPEHTFLQLYRLNQPSETNKL